MFYYVEGTVSELFEGMAVIDCGGVGYECRTSSNTISSLTRGTRKKLYTHMHVAEGICELYGFASQRELSIFRMLISVSGVGPKAAVSILSNGTIDALITAIVTEDEKMLTAAPGIGKKTAKRIILELKDKFSDSASEFEISGGGSAVSGTVPRIGNKAVEAAQALSSLGYSAQEVNAAIKGLDTENMSLEDIIRQALKKM